VTGHSPSKTGVNALMPDHPRLPAAIEDVDTRDKRGHDERRYRPGRFTVPPGAGTDPVASG